MHGGAREWIGVVGTGQSLAVGGHGDCPPEPFGGTRQRFGNLKLSLGGAAVPPFDPAHPALAMVPLVEPLRPVAVSYPSAYPANIYGQSFHAAMADQISALVRASGGGDYVTVHTQVGEAGQPFDAIAKGAADTGVTGRAYAASLFEVAAITRLARAAGRRYRVGAIVIAHGESDADRAAYEDHLARLWSDYNRDLPALTGQTEAIPLFLSQQHHSPVAVGSRSPATLAQWRAALRRPGDIVCLGPKYQYPHVADGLHLTNAGYDRLGEKHGQAFVEQVVFGRRWRPLEPIDAERAGRIIRVRLHVPAPPLVWDDLLPAPHRAGPSEWASGRGFEVRAGAAPVPIESVAIAGDTVEIACAVDLPAADVVVGYALSSDEPSHPAGPSRRGLLRDSDPFVGSVSGAQNPNFCVAFEMATTSPSSLDAINSGTTRSVP